MVLEDAKLVSGEGLAQNSLTLAVFPQVRFSASSLVLVFVVGTCGPSGTVGHLGIDLGHTVNIRASLLSDSGTWCGAWFIEKYRGFGTREPRSIESI